MISRALIVKSPAKINLTLRVGPRRPDGYHEVRTLLQSIAIADTLVFTPRRGPFAIATRAPGVPTDRGNLVWRAAEALWRAIGRPGEPRDLHVRIDKKIPMAAGLGGGSANAAATLLALNAMWEGRRSRRDLVRLAAGLGADVPFFLQGGTALGVGRGDEIYPVDDIAPRAVIVIKPSFGVATADAYGWLDADREAPDAVVGRGDQDVDLGWTSGPVPLGNDLEGPAIRRHPEIGEMVAACRREGAVAAAMTGSGSAVFGLFPDAVARPAARRLARPDWLVLLTRTVARREAGRRRTV